MANTAKITTIACYFCLFPCFSGCERTMDARWTTTRDTEATWESLSPKLPIVVYGQVSKASTDEIVHALPYAIAGQTSVQATSRVTAMNPTLDGSKRYIATISNAPPPEDDSFCTQTPQVIVSHGDADRVDVILSICDGGRLVAWSRKRIDPNTTTLPMLIHDIDSLKNLALIGISNSRSQEYNMARTD